MHHDGEDEQPLDALALADNLASHFGADLTADLAEALQAFLASQAASMTRTPKIQQRSRAVSVGGRADRGGSGRKQQPYIAAEVQAVVGGLLGQAVAPEQPLMEAGLDSLGAPSLPPPLPASIDFVLRQIEWPPMMRVVCRRLYIYHTEHPSVGQVISILRWSCRKLPMFLPICGDVCGQNVPKG